MSTIGHRPDILEQAVIDVEESASSGLDEAAYTELLLSLFGGNNASSVCAFTSVSEFSGKTTFSCTVASRIAQRVAGEDRKVALVDADSLLNGDTNRELDRSIASHSSYSNLWMWPQVARLPDASSGTNAFLLAEILTHLRRDFRYVIIDCPPILSSGLAALLCAHSDKTVLVVQKGSTRRAEIQAAQRVLTSRGVQLSACVLVDYPPEGDGGRRDL